MSAAGFFGVEVLHQLHRALDVGEEHGDGLALAVEQLGAIGGGSYGHGGRRGGSGSRRRRQWRRALATELGRETVGSSAFGASEGERRRALVAELGVVGIASPA